MAEVPRPQADAEEVLRLHRLWGEANVTGDSSFWDHSMHPDIVLFAGDGGVHRGLEKAKGEWQFIQDELGYEGISMETSEIDVRVFGDGAWVMYEFHLRFRLADELTEIQGRGTDLYERRDGEWRMAGGHWSWRS